MKVKEKKIKLKEIMIDSYNPRFVNKIGNSQQEIILHLQKGVEYKELLVSMLKKITWVNKIVVVPIEELSEDEKNLYRLDNPNFEQDFKYIIVEGNTRVACLHSEMLKKRFDNGELIPVIVVMKEEGESYKEFLHERKRLQSIANVMIVKEWDDVPKAKQMYTSYKLLQEIYPEKSEKEILKELADTLGIKPSIVKTAVYKYAFYKELIENSYGIQEKDFKYLEALHQNLSIQNMFGLDKKKMEFEWGLCDKDDEDINEITELKQQTLYMFPEIIEIAKDEKVSSKVLRDILRRYQDNGVEELYQKFSDICQYSKIDEYSNDAFVKYLPVEEYSEKEERKIKDNINSALRTLKSFPVNEDYSSTFFKDIEKIKDLADKIIKSMIMDKKDEEIRVN